MDYRFWMFQNQKDFTADYTLQSVLVQAMKYKTLPSIQRQEKFSKLACIPQPGEIVLDTIRNRKDEKVQR